MPNRRNPVHEASRLAAWQLVEIGREIRVARVLGGRTQRDVGRQMGTSVARVSRIERGLVPTLTVRQLARLAGAVGLKLYVRAYPAGRRLLDQPQLDLLARLRARSHRSWQWRTEVPMPIPGDLRAADAVAAIPGCTLVVELWTRLADVQAQTRSALLKQRDLSADRALVVIAATHANRDALRHADPASVASFPLRTRTTLEALASGRDPGANGIVFL